MKKVQSLLKKVSILLCLILAFSLLAACGGAPGGHRNESTTMNMFAGSVDSGGGDYYDPAPHAAIMPEEVIMWDAIESEIYAYDDADYYSVSRPGDTLGSSVTAPEPVREGLAEKIIYSVYADIETVNFDESIEAVGTLLDTYGAFIEHSSVSGINYASRFHGWNEHRHATFMLRVPVENLNAMKSRLGVIGNVVHESSSADNITSQFFDTQSRLNSLRIQEERLLDMLSKADDVPDLIAIEERLSDVRYQIEWFQTMLNNWQRQVDYSSVHIFIREVEFYTEPQELHRSYWRQIGDGFMSTLQGIGSFFMGLFKWIVIAAPVLVILAVIAFVTFIIIRKKIRTAAKKPTSYAYTPPGYVPPANYTPNPGYVSPYDNEPTVTPKTSEPVQPSEIENIDNN